MQPGVQGRYPSAGNAGVLDFTRFGGPPPAGSVQGRPMGFPQPGFLEETGYAAPLGEEDWAGAGHKAGAAAPNGAPGQPTAGFGGAPQPGGYGPYGLSAQGPQASMGTLESLFKVAGTPPLAGFAGGFPTSKPPTFPPPQPPAGRGADPQAAGDPRGSADFGLQSDDFPALGAIGRQASFDRAAGHQAAPGGQAGEAKAPPAAASGAGYTQLPGLVQEGGYPGRGGHAAQAEMGRAPLAPQPPPPPSQAPQVPPAQPPAPQGPPPMAPPLMSPPAHSSRPLRPGEAPEDEAKREDAALSEAEQEARQKYGLLGILKVIRMTDPDLNTLALGMDLTGMGLDLNSPMDLHARFGSPWTSAPARTEPEFHLPPSYYINPPALKTAYLGKFSFETLFYIFFNMPRDTLQAYAAAELYNRGWKYHRDVNAWFCLQEEDGQNRWVCFDPNTWEKHYYQHPLDPAGFLSDDDVNMQKMPQSQGGAPAASPTA